MILFSKENNVFPSLGELEQAGLALENGNFSQLSLTIEQIKTLKNKVDELLWPNYKRPICPTIITGIHIDNVGRCVVDRYTGLNCKWFLLREPLIRSIGNVRKYDLCDLYTKIRKYRRDCFEKNKEVIKKCESTDYVFGGCGGNPKEVIKLAREHL